MFNCFIDSDGPICDFDLNLKKTGLSAEVFKHLPGTYLWLPITPGAADAIATLKELDDCKLIQLWIATKTPKGAPYAYTEKALWYRQHFPWLEDRVILTQDKSLLGTADDIIIDDRPHKGNVSNFRGTFRFFNVHDPIGSWHNLTREILDRVGRK